MCHQEIEEDLCKVVREGAAFTLVLGPQGRAHSLLRGSAQDRARSATLKERSNHGYTADEVTSAFEPVTLEPTSAEPELESLDEIVSSEQQEDDDSSPEYYEEGEGDPIAEEE
jgi:hypothetical protein